jgi:hypothetical protein
LVTVSGTAYIVETYTKLFSSIVHSSVWREPHHVRLVWVTMLALANRYGYVGASVPGLADASRVTLEECEDALRRFQEPDRHSRSQEHEGRRIRAVDRGWQLLNHEKFREARNSDERREQNRLAQIRHRQKLADGKHSKPESAPVSRSKPIRSDQIRSEDPPTGDPPIAPKGGKRAWRRIPEAWAPNEGHRKLATELDVSLELELAKIRDFEFAKPRIDPDATFRTWLRTAAERQQRSRPYQGGNSAAENTKRAVERARRLTAEFEARQAASGEA